MTGRVARAQDARHCSCGVDVEIRSWREPDADVLELHDLPADPRSVLS